MYKLFRLSFRLCCQHRVIIVQTRLPGGCSYFTLFLIFLMYIISLLVLPLEPPVSKTV